MANSFFKLKSPLKVTFNITNRCNFKCVHCYNSSSPFCEQEELSLKEVVSFLGQLKKNEVFLVSINGGEPLIREDVLQIISEAKKMGFIVNLNTNGSLITKDIARKIAKLEINNIDVSLPAYSKETFIEFTGVDSFDSVVRGLRNLTEEGVMPHIAIPVTRMNLKWMVKIVGLVNSLELKSIHTIVVIEKGRAVGNNLTFDLKDLRESYLSEAMSFARKNKISLSLECPFNLGDELIFSANNISLDKGCIGGRYIACIQANGDVSPCALFPDYVVGNLKEKDFSSIWNSPEMSILEAPFFNLPKNCLSCEILDDCYGGCPATYLDKNSKKKIKDINCKYF